jgi:hypothetical protein
MVLCKAANLVGRLPNWVTSNKLATVAVMSASPESDHQPPHGIRPLWAQQRHFAPQKNSEPFRRWITVKSVTDLPIGA